MLALPEKYVGFRPGGRPELAGVMKGFVWHAQQAGAQVRTESLTAMSRNGGALPSLRADRGAVLHLRREQVHILGQRRDAHHVRHGDAARGIAIDEVAPRPSASKGDSRVWTLIAIKLGGTEIKLDVHGDPIPTEDGTLIPKHQISLTRVSRHHYRVAFVLTRHDLSWRATSPPSRPRARARSPPRWTPTRARWGSSPPRWRCASTRTARRRTWRRPSRSTRSAPARRSRTSTRTRAASSW